MRRSRNPRPRKSWPQHSGTQSLPGLRWKRKRNYLAEAFRIAAGHSSLICERPHLIAIVNHCRDLTSAALILPEVA